MKVTVQTTTEEAYRWALANADAVELLSPQSIRDRLRHLSRPIYQIYTQTLVDIVCEKANEIEESWIFETAYIGTREINKAVFEELKRRKKTDVIVRVSIHEAMEAPGDYLGEFINTETLEITDSFGWKTSAWASKLINVKNVIIKNTDIEDATWLQKMKRLRSLELVSSPIKDLSMLSDHNNIFILSLIDLKITDISFIEQYKKMEFLDLVGCPIKDYSPLLRIPPLRQLRIDEDVANALDMDVLLKHQPNTEVIKKDDFYFYNY